MRGISGWFRRNNTIMAQAKDLSRQLQEAWDDVEFWKESSYRWRNGFRDRHDYAGSLLDQLHRVARERDQERKKRLAAEDALLDMYLDDETNLSVKVSDGDAWLVFPNAALSIEGICKFGAPGPIVKRNLREWRDAYLEQAENEEE